MNAKAPWLILGAAAAAAAAYCVWPRPAAPAPVAAAPAASAVPGVGPLKTGGTLASHFGPAAQPAPSAAAGMDSSDLLTALEQNQVDAELRGNGREWMQVTLLNKSASRLRVKAEVGLVLESGRNSVVVVRPTEIELPAGQSASATLQTAATRSSNQVGEAYYSLTYQHVPRIEVFLTYVQDHIELTPGAIQTAILALMENLPLSSVSKFQPSAVELKSRFNTDAFRVESADILSALVALRNLKVPDSALAMTIDPQLRIETMIDPLCRAMAMQYYGITQEADWAYWKNELLSGDPSTRHYALFGIARFYPEIALEMLPKWAREQKTADIFRISAIQALAETQRPEALETLRQLAAELGRETELGRAATGSALALEQRLGSLATSRAKPVLFRASQKLTTQ